MTVKPSDVCVCMIGMQRSSGTKFRSFTQQSTTTCIVTPARPRPCLARPPRPARPLSTEAPTERTLSLGDDSSAPVTTQVVTSNSNRKGHRHSKLQVQGSALDAPFLTRLSDMSLRFPDPPTRPPPPATAASSSSRTVTM